MPPSTDYPENVYQDDSQNLLNLFEYTLCFCYSIGSQLPNKGHPQLRKNVQKAFEVERNSKMRCKQALYVVDLLRQITYILK